jgi:hypothetical protein
MSFDWLNSGRKSQNGLEDREDVATFTTPFMTKMVGLWGLLFLLGFVNFTSPSNLDADL